MTTISPPYPLHLKLTHLLHASHLLSTTSPPVSSHLMARHRDLALSKNIITVPESSSGKRMFCGGCGAVWIVGWNCGIGVGEDGGKKTKTKTKKVKRKEGNTKVEDGTEEAGAVKGAGIQKTPAQKKRVLQITYECYACNKLTRFEVPKTKMPASTFPKSTAKAPPSFSCVSTGVTASKTQTTTSTTTSTPALSLPTTLSSSNPTLMPPSPSTSTTTPTDTPPTKKRNKHKSRKLSLQEQLAAAKKNGSGSSNSGYLGGGMGLLDLMKLG